MVFEDEYDRGVCHKANNHLLFVQMASHSSPSRITREALPVYFL